jgi:hypothetical protein
VRPVGLNVAGIVNEVNGRCREAESHKGNGNVHKCAGVEEFSCAGGKRRRQDQHVLHPLFGSQAFDNGVYQVFGWFFPVGFIG